MKSIIGGISNVVHLYDIIVSDPSVEEHLIILEKAILRLKDAGLFLKKVKCVLLAPHVTYVGHRIDAKVLYPMAVKVKLNCLGVSLALEDRNS